MELQDVWKIYRMGEFDVPALQGIDLTIKTNEFVAITGPSGCGKSTMLNLIGCLDMPTRGKVFLEGKDISTFKSDELARIRGKKIGFIFQTFNLYPTLTALENIQLPMRIHEFPEKDVVDTSKKLLEQETTLNWRYNIPTQADKDTRSQSSLLWNYPRLEHKPNLQVQIIQHGYWQLLLY